MKPGPAAERAQGLLSLSVYQPLGGASGLGDMVFPGGTTNRVMAGDEPRAFGAAATFRF
ncbi:MAG: hypothetical protein NBV68_08255 [Erythrobacter sp.]|uniref:hypothetical protein n=1 Tax=Erythrobacter sp. TaxID=1042 RepID=UPI0025EB7C67|nr:hypothetical protein [Erythrobacter sp.]MCL9999359.1 hypothetical protein [Erythrobacter sp.]